MLLNIYRVDGTLEPPDDLVGTAHDIRTAISLLRLLRAHKGTDCKLQGHIPGITFETLTPCSINHASLLLLEVLLYGDGSALSAPLQEELAHNDN